MSKLFIRIMEVYVDEAFFTFTGRMWIRDITGTNTAFDVESGNTKLGHFLEKTLVVADR